MEPVHPLDEDEELDALLDDAADGIDGHEMMKEDENNNNNKTHTCENIGHETKQALSNQEKAFDPLAGNGKKARKKRRQRKGKDSTTSGGEFRWNSGSRMKPHRSRSWPQKTNCRT